MKLKDDSYALVYKQDSAKAIPYIIVNHNDIQVGYIDEVMKISETQNEYVLYNMLGEVVKRVKSQSLKDSAKEFVSYVKVYGIDPIKFYVVYGQYRTNQKLYYGISDGKLVNLKIPILISEKCMEALKKTYGNALTYKSIEGIEL